MSVSIVLVEFAPVKGHLLRGFHINSFHQIKDIQNRIIRAFATDYRGQSSGLDHVSEVSYTLSLYEPSLRPILRGDEQGCVPVGRSNRQYGLNVLLCFRGVFVRASETVQPSSQ